MITAPAQKGQHRSNDDGPCTQCRNSFGDHGSCTVPKQMRRSRPLRKNAKIEPISTAPAPGLFHFLPAPPLTHPFFCKHLGGVTPMFLGSEGKFSVDFLCWFYPHHPLTPPAFSQKFGGEGRRAVFGLLSSCAFAHGPLYLHAVHYTASA